MTLPSTVICTVGTSLFSNLSRLTGQIESGVADAGLQKLADAYEEKDWKAVAGELSRIDPAERICGAEINSLASLVGKGYAAADCRIFFLHSDTGDGHAIAGILKKVSSFHGQAAEAVCIQDLQDEDPKRFRTKGLRNLAKEVCGVIRKYSVQTCAINATGGYKAQIAIAVLLGQALGIPVYYKHELFDEIIAFPPMPVSLDFDTWMHASGMLFELDRGETVEAADYEEGWDEKYESLIEREHIDGIEYLDLTPTGQIFHETFRERFRQQEKELLPPPVPKEGKQPPSLENSGNLKKHPEIERLLIRLTDEVPQVRRCHTWYFHKNLSKANGFRLSARGLEGRYSKGGYCVKFEVETTAEKHSQQEAAMCVVLNKWLDKRLKNK